MTDQESSTAEQWIDYLYSLGPTSGNDNAYDESLTRDMFAEAVNPIEIACGFDQAVLQKVKDCASSGQPALILLTGMAGDGKTRTARVVWNALTQAGLSLWNDRSHPKADIPSPDGVRYEVVFYKDLSANKLSDEQENLLSVPANTCRVLACNHGRILDRIRALEGSDSALAREIEQALFEKVDQKDFVSATGLKVCVFDLSMYDPAQKFEDILTAILGRADWQKCFQCPHCSKCVIVHNRNALWDDDKKELKTPAKRQAELIRLIGCAGIHLPIRDLLIVAANDVLGAHSPSSPRKKRRLIKCLDVQKARSSNSVLESYVYANLLGGNLQETDRSKNLIFREFPRFGIGCYAPRGADEILCNPTLWTDIRNLVGGPTAKFLWDRNHDFQSKLAGELLTLRRQAMFFTYPDPDDGSAGLDRWQLTAFSFGGRYVRLLSGLASHASPASPDLTKGMNRVFTGQFSANSSGAVLVTTSGTNSKSMQGELLRCELLVRSSRNKDTVTVGLNRAGLPVIFFKNSGDMLEAVLTPHLFEFFMRAAEGYVPDSLSKECHSQAFQLKFRLIEKFAGELGEDYEMYLSTLDMSSGNKKEIVVSMSDAN